MIYTDLRSKGAKTECTRSKDTFFVSSLEVCFMARQQLSAPFRPAAVRGEAFGSRFVTAIVSGEPDGSIGISCYQVITLRHC